MSTDRSPTVLEGDGLTVAEALATRAARLKEVLDWARTRLDRADALANLATEPGRPEGPLFIHDSARALGLAEGAVDDVFTVLGEERETHGLPDLLALVGQAFDRVMDALPGADVEAWESDVVARLTVGELRARLSLTDQAGGRAAAETPAAAAR